MPAIHDHEINHETFWEPLSVRSVLEILELPALFAGVAVVCHLVLGAVPWWLFAGTAFYGTLAGWAVAAALWESRSAAGRVSQRE